MKTCAPLAGVVLVALGSQVAFAGEKETATLSLPGARVEATHEYSPSKKAYTDSVKAKEKALRSDGGKAWVNEARQPTKESTVRTEIGGALLGSGAAISKEKSMGTTSAAEEALRRHESNKKPKR